MKISLTKSEVDRFGFDYPIKLHDESPVRSTENVRKTAVGINQRNVRECSKDHVRVNRGQRFRDLDVESTRRGHLSSSSSSANVSCAVIVDQPSISAMCWCRLRFKVEATTLDPLVCAHRYR